MRPLWIAAAVVQWPRLVQGKKFSETILTLQALQSYRLRSLNLSMKFKPIPPRANISDVRFSVKHLASRLRSSALERLAWMLDVATLSRMQINRKVFFEIIQWISRSCLGCNSTLSDKRWYYCKTKGNI